MSASTWDEKTKWRWVNTAYIQKFDYTLMSQPYDLWSLLMFLYYAVSRLAPGIVTKCSMFICLTILNSQKRDITSWLVLTLPLLISFEIMLNFVQNSRFKFTDCLFYCIATPSLLVSGQLLYFGSWVFVEVPYSFLFSCIWDPSSLCVSSSSC